MMKWLAKKVMVGGVLLGILGVGYTTLGADAPARKEPATQTRNYFKAATTTTPGEYELNGKKYKISTVKTVSDGKVAGYIFNSAQFAPEVEGYGGTFDLNVVVDSSGKLLDFSVKSHSETPRYLKKVMERKNELLGKNIFSDATGFKGDAVSGATYTSKGIAAVLNQSGKLCAAALKIK